MKRTLLIVLALVLLLMDLAPQPEVNDCITDSDCEQRESAIDREVRMVYEKAARDGWIDESKERD